MLEPLTPSDRPLRPLTALFACPADAFAAQQEGIKALPGHVQRSLACALVTAAASVKPEAAVHGAVEHLLTAVVHELTAFAGAPQTLHMYETTKFDGNPRLHPELGSSYEAMGSVVPPREQ